MPSGLPESSDPAQGNHPRTDDAGNPYEKYLEQYHDQIECVSCGGESGEGARLCDYGWIIITKKQCIEYGVPFHFHQTGSLFKKGSRIYHIDRKDQEEQARKSGIDTPRSPI